MKGGSALTWERMGAGAGFGAAALLGISYAITRTTAANAAASDTDYVRALLAERMKWEWVTFLRLVGGTLLLWFMASLAGRLRTAEGEPGRLATAAFGLGVVWAGVWLLSALFNSVSILLASSYASAAGSRIAGVLARETPYVLSGSVMFALLLAASLVALRADRFPQLYTFGTVAFAVALLVLAVVDWYGSGSLGPAIIALALVWTAATSGLLVSGAARSAGARDRR
jgi:hypothetical protein